MARAIFAVGHMLPAFSLLLTASGVGLLLEGEPPPLAYWLASIGVGIYLLGTRAFLVATSSLPGVARALMVAVTFFLGRLHSELGAYAYTWVLAVWVVLCAALATRLTDRDGEDALARLMGGRRAPAAEPGPAPR